MIVHSYFDGCSCGQVALERAGIKVDKYYSSEIDKYAISITQKNFPNTIQLGDIENWRDWNIEKPDLILAGFPCTGFSFAGKGLNFNDPQSKLFFTFVDLLKYYNPKYFLLENVKMKKEYSDVISEKVGVDFIEINSSLLSAQNRKRNYWTNIPGIKQPEDKNILLKDVVFDDAIFNEDYTVPGRVVGRGRVDGKRVDHKQSVAGMWVKEFEINKNMNKSNTLCTSNYGNMILTNEAYTVCMHNLYGGFKEKVHRTYLDKSPTIRTASGRGHIPSLLLSKEALAYMNREVKGGRNHWDFKHHSDVRNEKSAAVVANFFKGVPYNVLKDWNCIRKFHPIECERLQTLDDFYTEGVSNSQRYKMIGNGWNVDTIVHILKNM